MRLVSLSLFIEDVHAFWIDYVLSYVFIYINTQLDELNNICTRPVVTRNTYSFHFLVRIFMLFFKRLDLDFKCSTLFNISS